MALAIDSVIQGDCREEMAEFPDNYFDSIICDPPYEIGFMSRSWDHSGIAYDSEVWGQCLRVLKPGGHLLSFGSTRTYHRMVCAIEDAGFEIRDCIEWVYGSGFPKCLNISKAIDKQNGREFSDRFALGRHIKECRKAKGISQETINSWFGYKNGCQHWERQDFSGASIPTKKDWTILKERLELSDEFSALVDRTEAEREVIGQVTKGSSPLPGNHAGTWNDGQQDGTFDITTPSTEAAKQWAGYGTALKPAHEPICVARKPISEKTIAENVLRWGTGGLNIDATRISTNGEHPSGSGDRESWRVSEGRSDRQEHDKNITPPTGRFPANLIHDSSPEVLAEFAKAGERKTGDTKPHKQNLSSEVQFMTNSCTINSFKGDSGSASRFFQSCPFTDEDYNIPAFVYYAKASRSEREAGLEGLPKTKIRESGSDFGKMTVWNGENGDKNWKAKNPNKPAANFHPTVKPLSLMRYLCRLVTPPNGLILDPFAGSGTTCLAAKQEGFRYVGIELQQEYVNIAKARLKAIPERLDRWAVYEKEESKC